MPARAPSFRTPGGLRARAGGPPPWIPDAVAEAYLANWESRRRVSATWRLLAPAVICFFVQVPALFWQWDPGSPPVPREFTSMMLLRLAILLVGPIALLFARRFPGPVVAVVMVAATADLLLAGRNDGPPYIAFAFAIGSAIVRGARIWAWASIGAAWIGTLVLVSVFHLDWQPMRLIGISFGTLVIVGAAEFIRTRQERMADLGRSIAARRQTEVQAERVRIARELHDVLAHSLSQINVQAGVGLHLIERQPEKAADALASIKESSKTALDEVRSVLGILRAEGGADPTAPLVPEPDLARLDGLAASVTSQGIDVALDNRIAAAPKPVELAIYRIVQESLTNVVRHARAGRVSVTLEQTDADYLIDVADDGSAPAGTSGGGRGILGMRERAELLGGTLSAGPTGTGFRVRASIPRAEQA